MALCTIIGTGPGIGLSVAKRFAKEGFNVAMIARDRDRLDLYSQMIHEEYGVLAQFAVADITQRREYLPALQRFSDTDVLVYNAAVVRRSGPFNGSKVAEDFAVNALGAFHAAGIICPRMELKEKGSVLFTGGGFAHEPDKRFTALSLGKAALWAYAMILAEQYHQGHIHVGLVTIHGKVESGHATYDPDLIAEEYWKLHAQKRNDWQREVHVKHVEVKKGELQ